MESFYRRNKFSYCDDYISSDSDDDSDTESVIIETKLYLEYDLTGKKVLYYGYKRGKKNLFINGKLECDISFKILLTNQYMKIWVFDIFYDIDIKIDSPCIDIKVSPSWLQNATVEQILVNLSLNIDNAKII